MRNHLVAVSLAAFLVPSSGCGVVTENVTYGPGLIKYPGYKVEYVEATPRPGTAVAEGAHVQFTVKVRYVLQAAPKGELALLFRDQRGDEILREEAVGSEVLRGVGSQTLSREVVIPAGVFDLWLWIPLFPEGIRDPAGILRIRYPVVRRR